MLYFLFAMLVFPSTELFIGRDDELADYTCTRKCVETFLCACHPFSSSLRRLEGFLLYLNKWMRGDEIDSDGNEDAEENILGRIHAHVFFESVVASAPQL